jgi:MurNAc alpha-1-phosphate uridylyltransferase
MSVHLNTAMILAAGLGTRMRPLTHDLPKPMVKVGDKTLIDWVLDDLAEAGVSNAVINVHYKADLLRNHLTHRSAPALSISDETEILLETGGGVAAALPLIDDDVFLVTNSDALWGNGLVPVIETLKTAWSQMTAHAEIDSLLLLAKMGRAFGFEGAGDFFVNADGIPSRRGDQAAAPTAYAGTQLVHRRIFETCPTGAFSFNVLWNKALESSRLRAIVHDDDWYHVGTPEAVATTALALSKTGDAS